jgi:hypothetical protein
VAAESLLQVAAVEPPPPSSGQVRPPSGGGRAPSSKRLLVKRVAAVHGQLGARRWVGGSGGSGWAWLVAVGGWQRWVGGGGGKRAAACECGESNLSDRGQVRVSERVDCV